MILMDGVQAVNTLEELTIQSKAGVKRLRQHGMELAEKDAIYKTALADKILELKEAGMAVTILEKVANGCIPVNKYRKDRDVAEVNFKASQEELYNLRLQIRVLEAQIKMEWFSNE